MNIIITGYYKKNNYGDDLFESLANKIFQTKALRATVNRYKIVPIHKLYENRTMVNLNIVVLFGGETLNNYFLDELVKMYTYKPDIIFKAIGVSTNQDYLSITNRMHLFDQVVFRSFKDYQYFQPRLDRCSWCPDIVFSLPLESSFTFNLLPSRKKSVGFFLSQTAVAAMTTEAKATYYNLMATYVRTWLNKGYHVKLFAMCTNTIKTENDNLLNGEIVKCLKREEQEKVKVYRTTTDILVKFPDLEFSVCWRYHAHVLSIIHNVPFLSLGSTPKVKSLLEENNLNELIARPADFEDKVNYLITHAVDLRKQFKQVFNHYRELTKLYSTDIYTDKIPRERFYLTDEARDTVLSGLESRYSKKKHAPPEEQALFLLFTLLRTIKSEYTYGLTEKLQWGLSTVKLKAEIEWLINESIFAGTPTFYTAIQDFLPLNPHSTNGWLNPHSNGWLNIKYMDQDEYKGLHRSGWNYVVNHLTPFNDSSKAFCDLYLDRSFHWNAKEYAQLGIIPYRKPWVGFIHHTVEEIYSPFNVVEMFKNPLFTESLVHCKGLCVLSEDLRVKVQGYTSVPVYALTHPTETPAITFTLAKFQSNKTPLLIQVGAWLRNLSAINQLTLPLPPTPGSKRKVLPIRKAVLIGKKMEGYYAELPPPGILNKPVMCRDALDRRVVLNPEVLRLTFHENADYDTLLSENIVFLNLIDASAVNTVLECIVRHTPIIVNRLPAVEEMLGENYPLFYTDLQQVSALLTVDCLTAGHHYLKKLNQEKFKIETFIAALKRIMVRID